MLVLQEYANIVAELTELYNNHVAAFPRVHSQVSPLNQRTAATLYRCRRSACMIVCMIQLAQFEAHQLQNCARSD